MNPKGEGSEDWGSGEFDYDTLFFRDNMVQPSLASKRDLSPSVSQMLGSQPNATTPS